MRALSATTNPPKGGKSTMSSSPFAAASSLADEATLSTSEQTSNGSGRSSSRPASPLAKVSRSRK